MLHSQIEAYMRARVSDMLTDTCSLKQEGVEVDSTGAPTTTTATVASGVKCRVIMVSGGQQALADVVGSRETISEEYRVILPYDQEVAVNYSITTTSDNATYRVQSIESNLSNRAFRSVIATRER